MTQSSTLSPTRPARVLIVDDHPVVREGLAIQLAMQPDLEICGEAEDVTDALAKMEETRPDVAIVDISLKTGNGIELIKRIRGRDEHVRILVWSMHQETLYAERALRAGAMGYVNKGRATQQILQAIRTVLEGKVYLSEDLSAKLLTRLVGGLSKPTESSPVESLSDRELEAFELMGRGLTTLQVSEKMHISPKTVDTYRARIKEKLGLASVAELVQRAAQWVLEST